MIMDSYPGIVMANDSDPKKEFGLEVRIDLLLPDENYPELVYPLFPPNMAKAPEVGQIIEVVVVSDSEAMDGLKDLGTVEFAKNVYYTGRIFDDNKGKFPQDLKTNYPKRCGFWAEDGTIIYFDTTKNKKQIFIKLSDGKNFIDIQESKITIQQDQVKMILENGSFTVIDSSTKLGSASAAQAMLKGTLLTTNLLTFLGSWTTAIGNLITSGGTPGGVVAYATAVQTALGTLTPLVNGWKSTKHNLDS